MSNPTIATKFVNGLKNTAKMISMLTLKIMVGWWLFSSIKKLITYLSWKLMLDNPRIILIDSTGHCFTELSTVKFRRLPVPSIVSLLHLCIAIDKLFSQGGIYTGRKLTFKLISCTFHYCTTPFYPAFTSDVRTLRCFIFN